VIRKAITPLQIRQGTSQFSPGVTLTQEAANPWGDAASVARAETLLGASRRFQNQHIMGWGTLNPEPAPGEYDFRSLDRRIDLIRRTRGIPVITLCCAPDWMKGGPPGATDWSKLELAPTPEHFRDFAELARRVALRYPDVRYYQVWNELKGFFDNSADRWDYQAYTQLYNQVYDAVKSANPAAKIGGPYVVVDRWADPAAAGHPSSLRGPWGVVDQRSLDVIDYWLKHKHGADFITIDASTSTSDRGIVTDEFNATTMFAAIAAWVHARTDLPLWWAEWYALPKTSHDPDLQHQSAVLATAMAEMAASGTQVALLWGPEAPRNACDGCLWTQTATAGGGRATPSLAAMDAIAAAFGPGTPLVRSVVSSGEVTALSTPTRTLLVNHLPERLLVSLNRYPVSLGPYATVIVDRNLLRLGWSVIGIRPAT
jgi:hypothetical protein